MAPPEPIVCKPTAWFICRAGIIFLMFAVFAVLFYIDGSTGYRKKNEVYVLYGAFTEAKQQYAEMNASNRLTAEEWADFAAGQHVKLPSDPGILPDGIERPMPWPKELHDIEVVRALQKNDQPWFDYSEQSKIDGNAPDELYSAEKIRNQWVMLTVCSCFSIVTLFFWIRTSRRSITATDEVLIAQNGRKVPYSDMRRLDLRKWENKGIATVDYEGSEGTGRIRIDGLTYGGFKKDHDQPAEKLMNLLRSKFSGELIEYTSILDDDDLDDQSELESKPES